MTRVKADRSVPRPDAARPPLFVPTEQHLGLTLLAEHSQRYNTETL